MLPFFCLSGVPVMLVVCLIGLQTGIREVKAYSIDRTNITSSRTPGSDVTTSSIHIEYFGRDSTLWTSSPFSQTMLGIKTL